MAITLNQWFDTVTGLQVSDLSSANKLVTNWLPTGPGRKIGATPVWTGIGSPVGTIGVESSNDWAAGELPTTARALTGDAIDLTTFVPAPTQPNVAAGRMPLAFESPGAFIRFTYLRTSGGTGAALVVDYQD